MRLAERLRQVADALPDTAAVMIPVAELRAWVAEEQAHGSTPAEPEIVAQRGAETWRTKLWTVPDETRLGVHELAEAVDRSPDWCYRAASEKWAKARGREPLPCSRLDGCLPFTAGAVRRWLEASERTVRPEPRPSLRVHTGGRR
jgi:hypothetical protein